MVFSLEEQVKRWLNIYLKETFLLFCLWLDIVLDFIGCSLLKCLIKADTRVSYFGPLSRVDSLVQVNSEL